MMRRRCVRGGEQSPAPACTARRSNTVTVPTDGSRCGLASFLILMVERETVCTFRTIEDVIARENELTRQATIDDLTGALKRDEALRRLARMAHARRRPGAESAVVFCDVDHFKGINDSRGHAVGDAILRETARRIRGCHRDADLIARMGGDEFLVVLDGIHSIEEAVAIADKIRRAVEQPLTIGSDVLQIHLSAG